MLECITDDISLENQCKIMVSYLVQHMLPQIKAPQFYTDLGLQKQCIIFLQMVKFKDFSRPSSVFQVLFKAKFIFKDFSRQSCIFKDFSSLKQNNNRVIGESSKQSELFQLDSTRL